MSDDFTAIARRLAIKEWQLDELPMDSPDAIIADIAEQLRLIWNARGAADVTAVVDALKADAEASHYTAEHVIKLLDR